LLLFSLLSTHAQPLAKRLDSLATFYSTTFDFNGSILVSKGNQVLISKGYGYQDKEKNKRNSPESIFLIGSITKQFTAEVVLMLAKEGKLSVDDKLSKYFPDYQYGDSITIQHLLTHTSGIFDYTRDEGWEKGNLEAPISDKELFALFRNKPLNFAPGTKWSYSNTGYKLLGLIIGKVTGKTYYENVRQRIFQPLGMTHSGFDFTHLADPQKTTGYYGMRHDSFLVSIVVDSTQTNSAGAIYSTTGDMLKWHRALQSYQLLPKAWQDKAFTPYKHGYGYGWENDSLCGKHVLAHSGHIHGYNSNFYHLPDEDVCVVVLTNFMRTGADPIAYAADIVRAMYDKDYVIPAPRTEVQVEEPIKKRYAGVYMMDEDTSVSFTFRMKDKYLYLRVTGQPEVKLLPQSDTLFFTKVTDAQMEFKKNAQGTYNMYLHQNGEVMEAKKVREVSQ